jgi:hypothetical protein
MPIPLVLSYTVEDELFVKATHTVFIDAPGTITLAGLQAFTDLYTPLFDAIIGGQILDIRIHVPQVIAGAKSGPVAGSRVEQTALFSYGQANSNYNAPIDVPSLLDTMIVNSRINLNDAAIIAYYQFQESAHSGIQTASKFGNFLVDLLTATITFRKRRRQLDRVSKEGD